MKTALALALALLYAAILALGGCGSAESPNLYWAEHHYDYSEKCTNAELVMAIKEFDISVANQIEAAHEYRRSIQGYFVNGDSSNEDEYTAWLTRTTTAYDKSHEYVKTATVKLGRCYD